MKKLERREIRPGEKWPAAGVGFDVRRGSFTISADVMRRAAETDDDYEIRRAFAVGIPDGAQASRREKIPNGGLRIWWRRIRVVGSFKRDRDVAHVDAVDLEAGIRHARHELGSEPRVALDAAIGFPHGEVEQRSESGREYDAAFASEPIHLGFELGMIDEGRVELAAELEPPADDDALR